MGAVSSACENCFKDKASEPTPPPKKVAPSIMKDKSHKYQELKTVNFEDDLSNSKSLMESTRSLNPQSRPAFKNLRSVNRRTSVKNKKEKVDSNPDNNKKITMDDFEKIKVLGRGSFGKVFFVQKKSNKKYYALKALKKENLLSNNQMEMALTEKNVLQNASHPFVVKLHYSFQNETTLYFVLDFCAGGELFNRLKNCGKFDEETVRFYAAEVTLGLEYLHEKLDIIYRDLKPENILLDAKGHIKITDFGLSKATKKSNSFCGTPEYLAPEILKEEGYDKTVDWWSLGCLIHEMLTGYPPFSARDKDKLFNDILHTELTFPHLISKNAKDLLAKLLTKDPAKRLGYEGAEDIKKHPFFASINWDEVVQLKKQPPYVPMINRPDDLRNFDKNFLSEAPVETPMNRNKILEGGETQFPSFTYVRKEEGLLNDPRL